MGEWESLAAAQHGVVARRQLLACGLTRAQVHQPVVSGRWRGIHPGVYVTHTGPVDDLARVWAGVLYAGADAAAGHGTALWLAGVADRPPGVVQVCVPQRRRVQARPGVAVHTCRRWDGTVHPVARPPRQRVEIAVLDAAGAAGTPAQVLDLVLRATQRRVTTAVRLRADLAARPRHRWRGLLADVLADAEAGVASPLERRYRTGVERAHGIPSGLLNAPEPSPAAGTWYRDVRYAPWPVVVELDGREAHPGQEAFRDRRRDNRAAEVGDTALRYGWVEVVGDPCGVAAQVATVLRGRGWPGTARPCSTGCTAGPP